MKVLVADRLEFPDEGPLERAGLELEIRPDLDAAALETALDGVHVLVVRSTKVTEAALTAGEELSLVVRAGAGTDNIDCDSASARGVFVSNVPGRNASAVAELTIGLLLAIDRRIVDATNDLRSGRWEKKRYSAADGIRGKKIGLYGLGSIGLEVASRAFALGMHIHVVDRPRSARVDEVLDEMNCARVSDLVALATTVDVLSLHCPLTDDTDGAVDDVVLRALGDDGILINTARGELVDHVALTAALDRGLRVGLDVLAGEPRAGQADFNDPILQNPNVVATPHIGASTEQAQRAIASGVASTLVRFAAGEVDNCINLRDARERSATVNVRHFDRPGVLAAVLAVLREHQLNVEHMDNRIFSGGTAAIALIDVTGDARAADICRDLDRLDGVIGSRVQPAR